MKIQLMRSSAIAALVMLGLLGSVGLDYLDLGMAQSQPIYSQQTPMNSIPTVDERLVTANTQFGFNLFSQLSQQEGEKNIFISPSSIAIALSMAYNGATGDTQQAMAQALEIQGLSLSEVNQAYADFKTVLENADPQVQLQIANSLWARQGITFNPQFLQNNRQFYRAQVTDLDFQDPAATQTINNWVKENTNGKINQIVDRLRPDDVLFLINAIYFKGNWTAQFDKSQTTNQPFYVNNTQTKTVPLMSQRGNYRYLETDNFQAISLPYSNGRWSLYVFLPKPDRNLAQFQQQLNAENWDTWMAQFRRREGSIQLPRFKMEYSTNLEQTLSALGMGVAFSRQAEFTQMTTEPVYIDQVKHKTFVEVNEEGTEAAAVTSIGIRTTSAQMPTEPFQMVVDRPFFCAIRDNQTGSLLFLGSIVDPALNR
ncbi:serpin family protein [Desertifilum sp. FACHB-1129]|uniref:Proteinase inhibitor I4 serpin n=1 Tax=Desertifilum tharense IPPAS B-1220 TaxID=1781255 RepID=A0A1E5QDR2_9CYAN|nr:MULTISPECIES: serpin family protein [Desertifilum]MDA0209007.1 serpin family protein [Cyanobacteria bacterium FC1]MBD2310489.1 serpin family protein [Desertifilum sp. FACHB-1129]MBD2321941.1 serpin family protein [Desertifilum sp. FACHB-866]MBD2332068.1 serpin family protein [Desertifilum sp. FACHB-868]OEJ72802.1 proteinase inhibitor I4 serpin [Desertifilum tharense IPPAS B-1220]